MDDEKTLAIAIFLIGIALYIILFWLLSKLDDNKRRIERLEDDIRQMREEPMVMEANRESAREFLDRVRRKIKE